MEKSLLEGAHVIDIQEISTDTYTTMSRVDGYFVTIFQNTDETVFRYFIGYDPQSIKTGSTPKLDAHLAAPDASGIDYAIPAQMSNQQRRLYMNARKGFIQLSARDFQ